MPIQYGQYDVPTVDVEVNFKVGQPSAELLPLDKIRKCAAEKFAENDPLYLQYGDIPGYKEFRESLAKFLTKEYGAPVSPSELFATNGNTGALALCCTLLCESGDTVFAEDPSYFLALRIFHDFKLNVVQVPMDEDGIDLQELDRLLQHHKPKMLYTVPSGHNPTGRTLSEAKRKQLVEMAYAYNFYVVADEVYHLLAFPGSHIPLPMLYFDAKKEKVVSLGSFSKILAPALRCGWLQAGPKVLKPFLECGQLDSSGGINPVVYGIVQKALDNGTQEEHLRTVQQRLFERATHLVACLDKYMPAGVTYEKPQGGYFVLVKLPHNLSSSELLEVCVKNKVRYLPGTTFGKTFGSFLRLSFSYYSSEDIDVGIQRLAQSIREFMQTKGVGQ